MYQEHWAYAWNGSSRGRVSCSGAFVWAYRQYGLDLYQGSNRIARRHTVQLIPIAQARTRGLIRPGMAAFKTRSPGQKGYALPDAYKRGGAYYDGDMLDYYHIGLVDEGGTHVLNAQSAKTGFVRSALTENWSHVAFLREVDYGEESERMTARVTGGRLVLRCGPGRDTAAILSIPDGAPVTVEEQTNGEWWRISAEGRTGYAMARYLTAVDGIAPEAADGVTVNLPADAARTLLMALQKALGGA